jgi:hypothetical protein
LAQASTLLDKKECQDFVERIFRISGVPIPQAARIAHLLDTLANAKFHYVRRPGAKSAMGTDVWRYFEANPTSIAFTELGSATSDVWIHFRRGVLLKSLVHVAQTLIHQAFHLL